MDLLLSSSSSSSSIPLTDSKPGKHRSDHADIYPHRIVYDYPKLSEQWPWNKSTVTVNAILQEDKCIERIRWTIVNALYPEMVSLCMIRFLGTNKERYKIPITIPCDRLYLREPRDSVYVEGAARYLRGLTANPPILQDEMWTYPDVGHLEERIWARAVTVGAAEASLYYGRLISPADWAAFNNSSTPRGEFRQQQGMRDAMMVPETLFPELPERIKKAKPGPHLPVEPPRMGYYFGITVSKARDKELKRRYDEEYTREYCVNYVISFLQDVKRGRIWDIRGEFNNLLKDVIHSLPSMPLDRKTEQTFFLSDFSKIRDLINPWTSCRFFITRASPKFDKGEDVYISKKLASSGIRCFISTKHLRKNAACGTVDLVGDEDSSSLQVSIEVPGRTPEVVQLENSSGSSKESAHQKSPTTTSKPTSIKRPRDSSPPSGNESEGPIVRRRLPSRTCKK